MATGAFFIIESLFRRLYCESCDESCQYFSDIINVTSPFCEALVECHCGSSSSSTALFISDLIPLVATMYMHILQGVRKLSSMSIEIVLAVVIFFSMNKCWLVRNRTDSERWFSCAGLVHLVKKRKHASTSKLLPFLNYGILRSKFFLMLSYFICGKPSYTSNNRSGAFNYDSKYKGATAKPASNLKQDRELAESGFLVNHARTFVGSGLETFEKGKSALQNWR